MAGSTIRRLQPHSGVDFMKPKGSPVFAPANGVVTKATHSIIVKRTRFSCGRTIEIKHNGLAKGFVTQYCQCAVKGAFSQWVRIPPGNCRSSR